jgi:lipopolysaccharide transport system ATP-binding protein
VKIKGRVASLLEVGTGFHPELTGRENIYLNGAILGMSRVEIRSKFDEIVAFAEIEKFLDTPVKRYSSGMYVRLAFAVAAHLEPEILIVDEVLAVGDAQFQKKCLGKMEDVSAKEGRTVIFVSHNMAAVQQLCSQCILLGNGVLRLFSDVKMVISEYYSSGAFDAQIRSWNDLGTAPGDEVIRLLAVRLIHDNKCTNVVPIDEDFYVEFDFANLKRNYGDFSYSIHILDCSGYMVFCSNSIAAANSVLNPSPYLYHPLPVGRYRVSVKIPGDFLNDQVYRLNVAICSNTTMIHVYEKEVLSFTVYETGAMREENHGYWGGVVRPRVETQVSLAVAEN